MLMESNASLRSICVFGAAAICLAAFGCNGGGTERGPIRDEPSGARSAATGGAGDDTQDTHDAADAGDFGNASGSGGQAAAFDAGAPRVRIDGGEPDTCAVTSTRAEFEPVYLAFAFDVSGSMGKGDKAWHDKSLKWDPVVAATRAFFEDAGSKGLEASLTFFPAEGGDDVRCSQSVYEKPDVEMAKLPSSAFADAIAAIEPKVPDDWRGGTPTAWVMRGTLGFIGDYRKKHPGHFAIVLVTDGYPEGCDDADDTVDAVVAEAKSALGDEIPTYVIGVANPMIDGAPDTVSDLQAIASAGGTDQAFIIDTGDPAQTTSAFGKAVEQIRSSSIACNLDIPSPPDGDTFNKERVAVTYDSAGQSTTLHYDAKCGDSTAWRYDDADDPHQIELCDGTCDVIKADPDAALNVQFACKQLLTVD
jgi:hypothetical protein